MIYQMYCHRKLGLPPKPRLWYNIISQKGEFRWQNEKEEPSPPSLKPRSFLRHSVVKLPKQNSVGGRHNLSEDQVSKWKQQFLENAVSVFAPTDQQSSEARVSDTSRISTPKLVLNLLNFGLNKRGHFTCSHTS